MYVGNSISIIFDTIKNKIQEKIEPLKKAQHNKTENVAGSV